MITHKSITAFVLTRRGSLALFTTAFAVWLCVLSPLDHAKAMIHYNKVEKGGHFAAWEQPRLFVAELRAAFRSVRPSVSSSINC